MDELERTKNKEIRLLRWWRMTLMPVMLLKGYETCDYKVDFDRSWKPFMVWQADEIMLLSVGAVRLINN